MPQPDLSEAPLDILILGLSNIVSRRALPALEVLSNVGRIDAATRKARDPRVVESWSDGGSLFEDYGAALAGSQAPLVYVSLINSEHERWARAALEDGRHVVVDKPAFLGISAAEDLMNLAARRSVCLAEATVFGYHPQISAMRQAFVETTSEPTRIVAILSFPPMDPSNFRYQTNLGGGALWDVGPYLAATGRLFFEDEPISVRCEVIAHNGDEGVDTAFSAIGVFPGGRSLVGHFGFDTGYCNRLEILGPGITVSLDRAFTTPPDFGNTVQVTQPEGPTARSVPSADSFALFFAHLLGCIEAKEWASLENDLLSDARTLSRYRAAAGLP